MATLAPSITQTHAAMARVVQVSIPYDPEIQDAPVLTAYKPGSIMLEEIKYSLIDVQLGSAERPATPSVKRVYTFDIPASVSGKLPSGEGCPSQLFLRCFYPVGAQCNLTGHPWWQEGSQIVDLTQFPTHEVNVTINPIFDGDSASSE